MRCTTATLQALGVKVTLDPITGRDVLDALNRAGIQWRPILAETLVQEWRDNGPLNITLGEFKKRHPKGRFIVTTSQHSMALVDGRLTDTAEGTDRRRIGYAIEVQ